MSIGSSWNDDCCDLLFLFWFGGGDWCYDDVGCCNSRDSDSRDRGWSNNSWILVSGGRGLVGSVGFYDCDIWERGRDWDRDRRDDDWKRDCSFGVRVFYDCKMLLVVDWDDCSWKDLFWWEILYRWLYVFLRLIYLSFMRLMGFLVEIVFVVFL